jgi:hypothetical protein
VGVEEERFMGDDFGLMIMEEENIWLQERGVGAQELMCLERK